MKNGRHINNVKYTQFIPHFGRRPGTFGRRSYPGPFRSGCQTTRGRRSAATSHFRCGQNEQAAEARVRTIEVDVTDGTRYTLMPNKRWAKFKLSLVYVIIDIYRAGIVAVS